ncbi:MAG: biotin--[acetyl-CoA-carboxylase] ligase, partial [Hyphomicrobiales bacterium]
RFEQWDGGRGFGRIRGLWLERAQGMGQTVSVALPDQTLSGTFTGLDDDGAMILRLKDGTERRVLAGDLFLSSAGQSAG